MTAATSLTVGMMLFDGMTQLDLTGLYEVLARMPDTRVRLIAAMLAPVALCVIVRAGAPCHVRVQRGSPARRRGTAPWLSSENPLASARLAAAPGRRAGGDTGCPRAQSHHGRRVDSTGRRVRSGAALQQRLAAHGTSRRTPGLIAREQVHPARAPNAVERAAARLRRGAAVGSPFRSILRERVRTSCRRDVRQPHTLSHAHCVRLRLAGDGVHRPQQTYEVRHVFPDQRDSDDLFLRLLQRE